MSKDKMTTAPWKWIKVFRANERKTVFKLVEDHSFHYLRIPGDVINTYKIPKDNFIGLIEKAFAQDCKVSLNKLEGLDGLILESIDLDNLY